jgi:hypothetical protein
MATGIPLPGTMGDALNQGVNTGSSMFARIMQPILAREQMAQREKQFQQELALRKAAQSRAGANMDLQRAIMEQQLLGLQHKNDPMYEMNQIKNLLGMFTGGAQGQGSQEMQQFPSEEYGEGMGIFTPGGMQSAQQQVAQPQSMNNELLAQNPIVRGFLKHKLGFNPFAPPPQTQEQKDAAALNLFKQKEDLKMKNKGGSTPTNAVLTLNQNAVQGIDTVLPMLDELIKSDKIPGIFDFSPGKKAAYNAKTSGMIDTLIVAQGLPKVQASIDLVEEQIRRKTGETTNDYKSRLKDLYKDLLHRRKRAQSLLANRSVNLSPQVEGSKVINGVTYYPDGQGGWEHD